MSKSQLVKYCITVIIDKRSQQWSGKQTFKSQKNQIPKRKKKSTINLTLSTINNIISNGVHANDARWGAEHFHSAASVHHSLLLTFFIFSRFVLFSMCSNTLNTLHFQINLSINIDTPPSRANADPCVYFFFLLCIPFVHRCVLWCCASPGPETSEKK